MFSDIISDKNKHYEYLNISNYFKPPKAIYTSFTHLEFSESIKYRISADVFFKNAWAAAPLSIRREQGGALTVKINSAIK